MLLPNSQQTIVVTNAVVVVGSSSVRS